MKTIIAILASMVFTNLLHAEKYEFQVHRFCDIQLNTTRGEEEIEIKVYPKAVDETQVIYKSKLTQKGERYFVTKTGIVFVLIKLPDVLVNDQNRRINSGNWVLGIMGDSKEYLNLKKKLKPISTFRHDYVKFPDSMTEKDMSDMSYLGTLEEK
ncbi:MAG: hypothetical protein H7A51_13505 [Akkermansiaceae bacterium]|nr:hypothetical protein [Akkermansiaceae bacterium]